MNDKAKKWIARTLTRTSPAPEEPNALDDNNCIKWVGSTNAVNGYGQTRISPHYHGLRKRNGKSPKVTQAHRLLYSLVRGPIPDGMTLDHRCENRWCVNPYHLEPETQGNNSRYALAKRYHGDRDRTPEPDPFEEAAVNPVAF